MASPPTTGAEADPPSLSPSPSHQRLESFDSLKGFLILLVILGHILIGSLSESLPRYLIYGFHMPLFLAVSGYLVSRKTLEEPDFGGLFARYGARLLLPWAVAFLIYVLPQIARARHVSPGQTLLSNVLYPWFHLWYVPAFFLMVAAVWLMRKLASTPKQFLIFLWAGFIASAALLIGWMPLTGGGSISGGLDMPFPFAGDKRLYVYFCFFAFGALHRQANVTLPLPLSGFAAFAFGLLWLYNFYSPFPLAIAAMVFLGLNLMLICTALGLLKSGRMPSARPLARIGYLSLPIYLWHMVPLLALVLLKVPERSQPLFYSLSGLATVAVIAAIAIIMQMQWPWLSLIAGIPPAPPTETKQADNAAPERARAAQS